MSCLGGGGGCGLCGTETPPITNLTPEEFEIIQSILSSLFCDLTANDLDWTSVNCSEIFFCSGCQTLLKEMKRLKVLLKLVSSQLDAILAKVKVKYAERPVWVKSEEITNDIVEFGDNEDEFLIDPFQDIKPETETILPCTDEQEANNDLMSGSNYSSEDSDSSQNETSDIDEDDDSSQQSSQEPKRSRKRQRELSSDETPGTIKQSDKKPKKVYKSRSDSQPRKLKSGHDYFVCHLCDIAFNRKEEKFLHHETIHLEGVHDMNESGTTRLYSTVCGKSSLIPGDLSAHNETFHPDHFKFVCLTCKPERRQFTSQNLLKAHQVIHTADSSSSFPCLLCKETPLTLSSAINLDNHLRRVHFHAVKFSIKAIKTNRIRPECDNPPIPKDVTRLRRLKLYPCRFCGSSIRGGLFNLRIHERKEHPEKFVHLCLHPHCGESFMEVNELLTCQETHKTPNGEPFKCFVCNGKFKDSPTLSEHLAAKHSKGGVKCDICHERISMPKFVIIHKAKVHGCEWPHKCPLCGKGFENPSALDDHIRAQHKDQHDPSLLPSFITCDLCPAQFPNKSSLSKHKRKDHLGIVYPCGHCGKSFTSTASFKSHEKAHLGIKDHVCHICGKGFVREQVLKMHLRVHTGEKPYVCHICSKAFNQHTPLKRHLDLHKKNGTWVEKETKSASKSMD